MNQSEFDETLERGVTMKLKMESLCVDIINGKTIFNTDEINILIEALTGEIRTRESMITNLVNAKHRVERDLYTKPINITNKE